MLDLEFFICTNDLESVRLSLCQIINFTNCLWSLNTCNLKEKQNNKIIKIQSHFFFHNSIQNKIKATKKKSQNKICIQGKEK